MNSKRQISVGEALKLLNDGNKLEGVDIDFKRSKVKALDAFKLGQAGIEVPDVVIVYDDDDVAYDPDFDDYEWKRSKMDPYNSLKQSLTVNIEIEGDVKAWIQRNGIEIDQLIEKLIRDFYSSNQMIKGK